MQRLPIQKAMNKATYRVMSLGGEPLTDGERREILGAAAESKIFRALIQVIEEDLEDMRSEACSPERLTEGTQAHWAGGADALNGTLIRIAKTVKEGQTTVAAEPKPVRPRGK